MGQHLLACLLLLPCALHLSGASDFPNGYQVKVSQRCSGGSSQLIGTMQDEAFKCAGLCDEAGPYCMGFNWRASDGMCAARTVGCHFEHEEGFLFFSKEHHYNGNLTKNTGLKQSSNFIIPNYIMQKEERCTGNSSTKIGRSFNDIPQCKALCDSREDCFGFNFRKAKGVCIVRAFGCILEKDSGSIFYKKNDVERRLLPPVVSIAIPAITPEETSLAPTSTSTSTSTTTETPDGHWELSLLFPNYHVMMYRTCLGDPNTVIGEPQRGTSYCASLCDMRPDCYGFTFFPKVRHCVVRTVDCKFTTEKTGALLYRKISSINLLTTVATPEPAALESVTISSTQTQPETTIRTTTLEWPTTVFTKPLDGFQLLHATRCFGGPSVPIGDVQHDLSVCAFMCRSDTECVGFNVALADGACALRTHGCEELASEPFAFYRRYEPTTAKRTTNAVKTGEYPGAKLVSFAILQQKSKLFERTSMITTKKIPTTTQALDSIRKNFQVKDSTRCTGGSSLALEVTTGLDVCAKSCLENVACFGFNYISANGDCALRNDGCLEQLEGKGVAFYVKIKQQEK